MLVDVLEVGLCALGLGNFVKIVLFLSVKDRKFALVSNRVLLYFGNEAAI